MADEKPNHDEQHDEPNPAWERFRVFVSKIAAIPKEEVDEKRREHEGEGKEKRAGLARSCRPPLGNAPPLGCGAIPNRRGVEALPLHRSG